MIDKAVFEEHEIGARPLFFQEFQRFSFINVRVRRPAGENMISLN